MDYNLQLCILFTGRVEGATYLWKVYKMKNTVDLQYLKILVQENHIILTCLNLDSCCKAYCNSISLVRFSHVSTSSTCKQRIHALLSNIRIRRWNDDVFHILVYVLSSSVWDHFFMICNFLLVTILTYTVTVWD